MPHETIQRAVAPPSSVPPERQAAYTYAVDGSSLAPTMTDIEKQALQVYNEALKRMEAAGHPVNQQLAHNIAEHVVAHGKFEPWMAGEQENLWKKLAQEEGRTLRVTQNYYGKPVAYVGSPSTDPVHTSTDVTILPSASADQEESELEKNLGILGLDSPTGVGYPENWAEKNAGVIAQLASAQRRLDTIQLYVDDWNKSEKLPEGLNRSEWLAILGEFPDLNNSYKVARDDFSSKFVDPRNGSPIDAHDSLSPLTTRLRAVELDIRVSEADGQSRYAGAKTYMLDGGRMLWVFEDGTHEIQLVDEDKAAESNIVDVGYDNARNIIIVTRRIKDAEGRETFEREEHPVGEADEGAVRDAARASFNDRLGNIKEGTRTGAWLAEDAVPTGEGRSVLNPVKVAKLYEIARSAMEESLQNHGVETGSDAYRAQLVDGMHALLADHMGLYDWAGASQDARRDSIERYLRNPTAQVDLSPPGGGTGIGWSPKPSIDGASARLSQAIREGLVTPEEAMSRWNGILEAAERLGNLPDDYRLDKDAIIGSLAGLTYAEASAEVDRVIDWYANVQSTDAYKRMGDAPEVERQFGAAIDTAWATMPADIGVSRDQFAAGLVGKTPEEANSSLATINTLGQQILEWRDLANERQREIDVLAAQQAFQSGESLRRNEEALQIKQLDHGQANYRADITRKDAQALNAANYAQRERENVIGLAAGQQQLAANVQQQRITGIEAIAKAIADQNMQLFTTLSGTPLPPSQPGARIGGANIMDFLVEGVGAPLPGYAAVGGPLQLPDIPAGFAEALALRRQQAPPALNVPAALGAVSAIAPEIQQIVGRMLHPEAVTPAPVSPSAYNPIARQPYAPVGGVGVESVVSR